MIGRMCRTFSLRWTIDTLSVLTLSRTPSFSTVTVFSCTVIILYGPVFFARNFCDGSLACLDVIDELMSK